MSNEHWWKDTDRGKTKYSDKNQSQGHFIHHKSYTQRPQINMIYI
jgi:hypothetical protein